MKPLAEWFFFSIRLSYPFSKVQIFSQPHESTPCEPGERDQLFTLQKNITYSSETLDNVNFETIISSSPNHTASHTRL